MAATIIPHEGMYYIKNSNQPDTVFLENAGISKQLLLMGRPRGTANGETVGKRADGSPLPEGYDTSSFEHVNIIYSANGKWKAVEMIHPDEFDKDAARPPEEQRLTEQQRTVYVNRYNAEAQPLPGDWDDPEAP